MIFPSRLPARRGWRNTIAVLALLVAILLTGSAGRAFAHAALISVQPVDGSVVAKAPKVFSITFSEPVSPLILKLIRPDGSAAALERYVLRDTVLDIDAPGDLDGGTYVLSWRVVSEDGHPVGGSSLFSIGTPSAGGAPAAAEPIDWPLDIAIWAVRTLLYVGLFFGAGGAFFIRFVGGGPRAISAARGAALVGLIVAPLSMGLLGLDGLDLPLSRLTRPIAWSTGWSTSYGTTALLAGIALAAAFAALVARGMGGRLLAAIALVGVGLALAASGHAGAAEPRWLTRPAVFLHAVGIAFWAGALWPLGTALLRPTAESRPILRRFSRTIPFAVLPLAVAGLLLAVIQVQRPEALWTTAYGRVLIIKLALLAALFALAAVNRFRLTARAEQGEAAAVRRLRRSIAAELLLVVAIFAVAALWRFTPPPRVLAEAAAAPATIHIHTAQAMADISLTPGHVGTVAADISILTGDFGPLDAKGVTLVLSDPAAGVEPIRREATKGADAAWHIGRLDLPIAGRWQVRIDILVDDFTLVKLEDAIEVRR